MTTQNLEALSPIKQEEVTGCGIASVANILGLSYQSVKTQANLLGIYAEDTALYSNTAYVRLLLDYYLVQTHDQEMPFIDWQGLPDIALLAIKYYEQGGSSFWHWVVFKRISEQAYVLDSSQSLTQHLRRDFDAMKPKWFIPVFEANKAHL